MEDWKNRKRKKMEDWKNKNQLNEGGNVGKEILLEFGGNERDERKMKGEKGRMKGKGK